MSSPSSPPNPHTSHTYSYPHGYEYYNHNSHQQQPQAPQNIESFQKSMAELLEISQRSADNLKVVNEQIKSSQLATVQSSSQSLKETEEEEEEKVEDKADLDSELLEDIEEETEQDLELLFSEETNAEEELQEKYVEGNAKENAEEKETEQPTPRPSSPERESARCPCYASPTSSIRQAHNCSPSCDRLRVSMMHSLPYDKSSICLHQSSTTMSQHVASHYSLPSFLSLQPITSSNRLSLISPSAALTMPVFSLPSTHVSSNETITNKHMFSINGLISSYVLFQNVPAKILYGCTLLTAPHVFFPLGRLSYFNLRLYKPNFHTKQYLHMEQHYFHARRKEREFSIFIYLQFHQWDPGTTKNDQAVILIFLILYGAQFQQWDPGQKYDRWHLF